MPVARLKIVFRQMLGLLRSSKEPDTAAGRAHERHRLVIASAAAAGAAKVISVLTAIISVPLTLHYLGRERYGMWVVLSSFTAILSFADLGMGNGLLNLVAESKGSGRVGAIRGYASSAYFALSTVAVILLAGVAVAYPFVPWDEIFNVKSAQAQKEAGPAIMALCICIGLAIPLGVVQRVQIGLQQGFYSSLWQCLGSILSLAAVLLAIFLNGNLPALVFALAGTPLIAAVLNTWIFFGRSRPDLRPSIPLISRSGIAQIVRVGFLFFVLQAVAAIAFWSDSLIIAQRLGADAVADYAVPERMFSVIGIVIGIFMMPLWPAYGEAISRGDHDWVKRTLWRSTMIVLALSTCMAIALELFGDSILKLWVGHSVSAPLLLMLMLGLWKIVETFGMSLAAFLNGANVIMLQICTGILTAAAALYLKLVLAGQFGISGVVMASIGSYIVFTAIPVAVFLPRIFRQIRSR